MGLRNLIDRSRGAVNDALQRIRMPVSARPLLVRTELDLVQLEDRIMLSESPIGDLLMPVDADPEAAEALAVVASPPSNVATAAPTTPTQPAWRVETQIELVFVDQGVQDYERMVADLLCDADPMRHFEVVLLDENRDGIEQISEVLQGYTDLSAIHLVSHGSAGRVNLGNLWLSDLNIDAYAGQIAGWNNSLRDGADLLIYGCDLASTEAGRTLVESLGALCDCDVAASDDDTGHVRNGGDWVLEYTTGTIESKVAFGLDLQQNWTGPLAVVTVDTTADLVDGNTSSVANLLASKGADGFISLREAIIATNNTVGADEILLSSGTYVLSIAGTGENAAATGDLDIIDTLTITGAGADTTTIDGGAIDRVFDIKAAVSVSGVTVTNGSTAGDGGAFMVSGDLTLTEVAVTGNAANNGGGMRATGSNTITMDRVTVSGNTAVTDGGAIYTSGAAADVTMTNTTISGNAVGGNGGAIYTDSTVTSTN